MKKLFFSSMLSILFLSAGIAQYDDEARSGYEGDFFSLEGALELFKDAHSIRNFERKLNSENSYVNNLDLNYDGHTDYIRVEHKRSGRYHAIIMQAIINRRELQDVAVIEFEKIHGQQIMLQIVGDEDLYGERVVIESYDDNYEYNNDQYVNAYYWPIMRNIFAPTYVTYVSPYAYSYYPGWYSPWNTYGWNVFYPRIVRYRRFCRVAPRYRLRNVYNFYRPYRRYCPSVRQNTVVVRGTRGRNSYYYGSNRRSNRGNNVAYNSNAGRKKARGNTKSLGANKSNRTYASSSKNPRPSASRPAVKNNTSSKRPSVKNNSSKYNSRSQNYRPARKPASSQKKPTRSYKPNNTVKKPSQRPQANKPNYNRPAKRPSAFRGSGSKRSGISRGASQVRKPASSSRSSSVRTVPKRSTASSKPNRSSKPTARPSSRRPSSSKSSVSSRGKISTSRKRSGKN